MNKKSIIAGISLVILGLPFIAFAQGLLDNVNVSFNPRIPGENQDVTISLNAYTMDLDGSNIIWYVNKDPIKQGVGVKSAVVRTGNIGTKTEVTAVIFTPDGRKIDKVINLVPSEIDILWEAQTYTPPFYKGKALPTYKSDVRVSAIPRYGSLTSDPEKFYYEWRFNRTDGVGKGLGRDAALIRVGYAGTAVPVSVNVSLPGESWTGIADARITPVEASVLLYEQAPLLGTRFQKAIRDNIVTKQNEIILRAIPFFYSTEDYNDAALIYNWKLGTRNAIAGIDPTVLTVKKQGTGEEAYQINLSIDNPKHVLQMGNAGAFINFSDESQR